MDHEMGGIFFRLSLLNYLRSNIEAAVWSLVLSNLLSHNSPRTPISSKSRPLALVSTI